MVVIMLIRTDDAALDAAAHRLDNLAMSDIAPDQDESPGKLDRISLMLMYKPIGMIGGVVGGLLASMAFARIWRAIAGKGKAPEATDKSKAGPTSCLRLHCTASFSAWSKRSSIA
jgi:Protein of unknown function (DUF4235)